MFCGHCGFENSEDSQSCAGCGKPLAKELPSREETKKQLSSGCDEGFCRT